MRKYMSKEVTFTTIKMAEIKVVKGKPEMVQLPDIIELGDLTVEKAQKLINKQLNNFAQVYEVETETKTYKMKVTDFIKVAELVDGDDGEEEDEDEE